MRPLVLYQEIQNSNLLDSGRELGYSQTDGHSWENSMGKWGEEEPLEGRWPPEGGPG